jgi:hypothetical protein
MRDTYSSDDYPFTVEDWSDPDHLDVIAPSAATRRWPWAPGKP